MSFNMQDIIYDHNKSLEEPGDVYEYVENKVKQCLHDFLYDPQKQTTHTEYLVWRDIQKQLEKEQ